MTVKLPSKLLREFKALAKSAWPKEAIVILLGRSAGDTHFIEEVYVPENQRVVATPYTVSCSAFAYVEWWTEARAMAKEEGLEPIGTLHSHPYKSNQESDASPSDQDWDCWPQDQRIQGILTVQPMKNGKFRTSIRFWPAKLKVRLDIHAS